mgnify:CR=1 FL=1
MTIDSSSRSSNIDGLVGTSLESPTTSAPSFTNQQTSQPQKIQLDPQSQQIKVDNISCELTRVEFQLLRTMSQQAGRIYSRDQLMNTMYDDNRIVSDRTIDSHIKKLRKRLNDYFPNYEFIHSVYGAGYRFDLIEANSE